MNDAAGNHPAYQKILDALPESLHSVVIPVLKEWDAGVTKKFQEIHQSYEGLKPFQAFVDNGIDPEYAEKAVIFANEFQENPSGIVAKANETWKLGYLSPEQAAALQKPESNSGDEFDLSGIDGENNLLENPQIKAIIEANQKIQEEWEERKRQEEEEEGLAQFESELESLESKYVEDNPNLPFNKIFVTALMQQGLKPDEAVKQWHQVLAGAAITPNTEQDPPPNSSDQPPVVMGGNGQAGSGTPDGAIKFGDLSKNDTSSAVEKYLEALQQQDSGQG